MSAKHEIRWVSNDLVGLFCPATLKDLTVEAGAAEASQCACGIPLRVRIEVTVLQGNAVLLREETSNIAPQSAPPLMGDMLARIVRLEDQVREMAACLLPIR